jgi:broad specificity phosphatase PhoE
MFEHRRSIRPVAPLAEVTDFCRLLLFRHPELDAAKRDVALGSGSAPLSRRGRAAVLEWIARLDGITIDAVYAADVEQCLGPARALAEPRGLDVQGDARLRDQRMGDWEGRPWAEIVRDDPDRVHDFFAEFGEHRPPGGESLGEAVDRMLQWWTGQAPALLGKTAAVVLSGNLISGFAAAMLGMRLSRSPCLPLPHGGLAIADVYQNGMRIASWNATALEG